jgi:ribonucleotide monophosphatase NagD (HAD superfamily)
MDRAATHDRARVLAIGDGLMTDLAGARAQGLDALFIADGVHAAEVLGPSGLIDEGAMAGLLGPKPPAYAMRALIW